MPGDRFKLIWGETVTLLTEFDGNGKARARVDSTGEELNIWYRHIDETWKGDEDD